MKRAEKGKSFFKRAGVNALKFAFNVLFAYVFQVVFGPENILVGVALCVGLTTLPEMDTGIQRVPMAGIIVGLNLAAGLAAQFALTNIWLALPVNALFVAALLLLSAEPVSKKTAISFLLCFIFCQANPVPTERLGMRMAALLAGSVLIAAVLFVKWKRRGIGDAGRTLSEQIRFCALQRGYIFRSALGISVAMAIGMAAGLKRPMWISIVVMSLTQVDFEETRRRIMYRSMATILGAAVFLGILVRFMPGGYAMLFVLCLGYISFFTTKYQYTQIVNTVSALNAALIVLDSEHAVVTRVFCLALGILVTLCMWKLETVLKQVLKRRTADAYAKTASECEL